MRIKLDARGTANVAKMREMMEGMDGLRSLMEQMQQALIELQAETLLAAGYQPNRDGPQATFEKRDDGSCYLVTGSDAEAVLEFARQPVAGSTPPAELPSGAIRH